MSRRRLDPLPAVAFQIIRSLADGELHGYATIRQVEEPTCGRLRLGCRTLYRSIQALLEGKLLERLWPNDAGISSFKVLDKKPVGLGSILVGGTISLVALAAFPFPSRRQPSTSLASTANRSAPSSESKTPPMALNASPRFEAVAIKPSKTDTPDKMSFEVASVRQSKPGTSTPPNFALDNGDSYAPFPDPGGRFTADFSLPVYINFAYKLWPTPEQTDSMLAHLPKWVATDNFEIHAKAEGNPTKDQMRLMMQSLLADRFKLAIHFETQQIPVFALVLEKPGRTGPKLRSHSDGPPCDVHMPTPGPGDSANIDGVFPRVCDAFMLVPAATHEMLLGSRNTTMKLIANSLPELGRLGRPVVDQTGLTGRFDFTLQWTRESNGAAQLGTAAPLDSQGTTTFLEALKEQLGLKLKSTKAPMDILVVDHVERPSEN